LLKESEAKEGGDGGRRDTVVWKTRMRYWEGEGDMAKPELSMKKMQAVSCRLTRQRQRTGRRRREEEAVDEESKVGVVDEGGSESSIDV
jgi:hypothetical protein